jgi:hypothetical protein
MFSYFTELHVQTLARGLLEPQERLLGQTATEFMPWWGLGFVRRTHLVLATQHRVVVIEHRVSWFRCAAKMTSIEALPWHAIDEFRITRSLFGKKLVVRARTLNGIFSLKSWIPNTFFGLLAPMENNVKGARAAALAFDTTRQLGGAPGYESSRTLPPSPDETLQTPMYPAALEDALTGPLGARPGSMPPINAPGYVSVPPSSTRPSVPPPLPPSARSGRPCS